MLCNAPKMLHCYDQLIALARESESTDADTKMMRNFALPRATGVAAPRERQRLRSRRSTEWEGSVALRCIATPYPPTVSLYPYSCIQYSGVYTIQRRRNDAHTDRRAPATSI